MEKKPLETTKLRRFAQYARRSLIEQVTAKLKSVLVAESAARREHPVAVQKLEEAIRNSTQEQVIERVAYTWFNRFCALRFMDVNRYNKVGVVSPLDGQFQPEILAEAKMGHIDDQIVLDSIRQQVADILDGKAPSRDPQGEAYRMLVVAVCNYWHKAMPFLFQRIDDFTELLMPEDLLSGGSILAYTREAMTPDVCEDVEVIGWLYQFYISEKKDEVFEGLKKNKKITPENIPAATQLFTPDWIVRYLVENSLGRLWMLNRPESKLVDQMAYYIRPEQAETDFLRIERPEEIKVCDPACGSGHMLTYAFDLLYAIYEEEGYEPTEIAEKVLTHNLYGIEIDERAGELAAFALTMKARAKQRRFLTKKIRPNICVLQNVHFEAQEIEEYMDFVGRDLFTTPLQKTLVQFEEADNFGSLIRPVVTDVAGVLSVLDAKDVSGHLFLSHTHEKVLTVLDQADYLSQKYHVVVANPPYMGGKGMSGRLAAWLKANYADVKSDLFSAFIVRNTEMTLPKGQLGFMTPFVWMFISSYEKLRGFLINQKTITSLVQLEYSGFDGATVPICTFTLENTHKPDFRGGYIKLSQFKGSENQPTRTIEAIQNPNCGWFYRAAAVEFNAVPSNTIAYWASKKVLSIFKKCEPLSVKIETREGLTTGSNDLFLRLWHEVQLKDIGFGYTKTIKGDLKRYFPCIKGGNFRRWSGNFEYIVNWFNDGEELKVFKDPLTGRVRSHNYNGDYAFRVGFTWSGISSGTFAIRHVPTGFMFDTKGPMGFSKVSEEQFNHEAFLNSTVTNHFLKMLAPTLDFKLGHILSLPISVNITQESCKISQSAVDMSTCDWNSYETSWDFTSLPLLNPAHRQPTLQATYQNIRAHWQHMTDEMQRLEQENNRIFIDAYGLQDELTSDVPLKEITLTCNPHYRYGGDKTQDELEALLLADSMRELVSYAVGCMFGRYSLDQEGLILANQGDTLDDYLHQIPEPSFTPDADNVIPILDREGFEDDITSRFRQFLRTTFGEQHYLDNLQFIEHALVKNGKPQKIRDYFLKEFYTDHVKRYKKRPIYWLFSSPKGTFNALIYMHRYRPDTVSIVLNNYLRELRTKLSAEKANQQALSISGNASPADKTKALKEIDKISKMLIELEEYEHDTLYPLATQQIQIDLDDGVKVNYLKFGSALKKIAGLDAKED